MVPREPRSDGERNRGEQGKENAASVYNNLEGNEE
jgi:hypothetical protein